MLNCLDAEHEKAEQAMTFEARMTEEVRVKNLNKRASRRRLRKTTPSYPSEEELERQKRMLESRAFQLGFMRAAQRRVQAAYGDAASAANDALKGLVAKSGNNSVFVTSRGAGQQLPVTGPDCGLGPFTPGPAHTVSRPGAADGNRWSYEARPTIIVPLNCQGGSFELRRSGGCPLVEPCKLTLHPVGKFANGVLEVAYDHVPYSVNTSAGDRRVPLDMRSMFEGALSDLQRRTWTVSTRKPGRMLEPDTFDEEKLIGATLVGFLVNVVDVPEGACLYFVPAPE